jgi:PAS domain-containing protein
MTTTPRQRRATADRNGDPAAQGAAATAELEAGRRELERMAAALDLARHELARAAERLASGSGPGGSHAVRATLSSLLPALDQPAALVDGDLWVVACNDGAAAVLGAPREEAVGTSLARWPRALERSRLVRRALASAPGVVPGADGDLAVSLGFDDPSAPTAQRYVLLLPAR